MPDLDQIKQEEQERGTGAGGFPRASRAIPGRPVRHHLAPLCHCERSEAISRPLKLLGTRLLRRLRRLAMTGTNLVEICF
jgi:hypothetical protein